MSPRFLWTIPLVLLLAACGNDDRPADPGDTGADNGRPAAGAGAPPGDDHGEPHPLGKLTAHGRTFEVVQMGDVEAGHEGAIELQFASGKERITTIRAWLGTEDGRGSMKSRMMIEGEAGMHGHLEVPDPIPANSRIWLECEVDGKAEVVSIAYRQ